MGDRHRRRDFFGRLGALGAALLTGRASAGDRPAGRPPGLDDFVAHLGRPFRLVDGAGRSLTARLVRAEPLPRPSGWPGRPPFALRFAVPEGAAAPQDIYAVDGGPVAREPILLVPMGTAAGAELLEAIFG